MKNFHFACPGEIFFGPNCIEENAPIFSRCGKRAYIFTSKFPAGVKNLALDTVTETLEAQGIAYAVNDSAPVDPPAEASAAMVPEVRQFGADIIIAVGGGSAMDTAKCVNILLKYPGQDAYDVLFGSGPHVFGVGRPSEGALPFITVATTAGTGADITGVAVMTRTDLQTKSGTNRRCFADYVFVDPRFVHGAPKKLNQATAVDALCHGLETYVSRDSRDNFMTTMIAEAAFRIFASFKDPLLRHEMSEEDYINQALHSTLQGINIVNEVTGVPHGLGYPLSTFYHVPHGLACGIFEGEYLRIFHDRDRVERAMELLDFESVDEFCSYIQDILTPHIDLKITRAEIEEWTDSFCATQWRLDRHPEPLERATVKGMYERALAKFLVD